jgi:gentisate 1,2-dioxygenase
MPDSAEAIALRQVGSLPELNTRLEPCSFRAGWNKAEPSLWPSPRTSFRPALWKWENAKSGLDAAGRLINTELADRRNLFLVNPIEGNHYATLRTLVSAYQMILPGERAKSHRHSPNALRLVLDVDEECYTIVDGVRIDMKPGDVVLTPNWCWHGHGNDGKRPGYWIDFLDVPLVQLLEGMFLEHWPDGIQTASESTRESQFVFSWDETQTRLAGAVPDEFGRTRIELGSPALPTIALHVERVGPTLASRPLQTTANQVVAIVSGSGQSVIDGVTLDWTRGDVFTVPAWKSYCHQAGADAVLLYVSDSPVHEKLGFFRLNG